MCVKFIIQSGTKIKKGLSNYLDGSQLE